MCFAGETPSGVIVLESAVRQYEDVLGIRHPGISTLSKKAEKLLSNLEPEQREEVCCNKGRVICYTASTSKACTMPMIQFAVKLHAVPSCATLASLLQCHAVLWPTDTRCHAVMWRHAVLWPTDTGCHAVMWRHAVLWCHVLLSCYAVLWRHAAAWCHVLLSCYALLWCHALLSCYAVLCHVKLADCP